MSLQNFTNILRSFKYAGRGVWYVVRRERTFQIHVLAAIVVGVLIIILPLRAWEVIVLVMMVVLVMILEIVNTAMEKIIDVLKPRIHFYVQIVKDLMAAAVLLGSLAALVVGLIIFWPHIFT